MAHEEAKSQKKTALNTDENNEHLTIETLTNLKNTKKLEDYLQYITINRDGKYTPLSDEQKQIITGGVTVHTAWRTSGGNSSLECEIPGSGSQLKDSGFHTFEKTGDNIYYLDDDVLDDDVLDDDVYRPVSIKIPEDKLKLVDVNVLFLDGNSIKVKLDTSYHTRDQIKKKIEQSKGTCASLQELFIGEQDWQKNSTLDDKMNSTLDDKMKEKKNSYDINNIQIQCVIHLDHQGYKRDSRYKLTNESGDDFTDGKVAYVRFRDGDKDNIIGEIEKEEYRGQTVYYKMKLNKEWDGNTYNNLVHLSNIRTTAPTIEEIEEFKGINYPPT